MLSRAAGERGVNSRADSSAEVFQWLGPAGSIVYGIAVKGRDAGFEIVYEGIRLTPSHIARAAQEEGAHLIGLSVLSGSHLELVEDIQSELKKIGATDIPLIIGGIIPEDDARQLLSHGVQAVFTPKDVDMNVIMTDMVNIIRRNNGLEELA